MRCANCDHFLVSSCFVRGGEGDREGGGKTGGIGVGKI